jgi:ribosomal protein S18 acetylase RimI-like enzyme
MKIKPISQESFREVEALASPHVSNTFNPPLNCYSGVGAYNEEGVLIGYITLFPERPRVYSIPSLATRFGYENKGIMRALFNALFDMLPGTYWLEVHEANTKARNLYTSLGFEFTPGAGQYNDGTYCLLGERKENETV